jgi:glycine/D-amino acid oxidase-like deaminating enzyme
MAKLRVASPLWLDRSTRLQAHQYPTCRGDLAVDVAIVGGGVTGAAVALMFAEAGVRVALLEAAGVGRGSTAASTALLMQEPDKDFHEMSAKYGRAAARRIWHLSRLATREFVRTLKRLDVACDLAECDSVYFTTDAPAARQLAQEQRLRRDAGLSSRWLDRSALRRLTGISGAGAIRSRGNAQVDPYRACVGLLRAAERRGARIFERSPVRRIKADSRSALVVTRSGTVRADRVVIATGYATPEFKPLAGRFRMMHTYVVATNPIDAAARAGIGLGDVMLWNTERPYHYGRWTSDHRLMIGGADRPHKPRRARRRALREGADAVRQYFEGLYPALANVGTAYEWEGLFATTPDGLPYIGPHRRYPRQLFALGYGGNGMTFGFLAAKLLLDWYRGVRSADHRLFAFGRTR